LARDLGEGDCAVSRDFKQIEREIAQAARWAVKWRMLQNEALEVAGAMRDPEARRHMLFIAEAYRLLAERAKERSVRLARLAMHMKR
jgi:hypothetical protein